MSGAFGGSGAEPRIAVVGAGIGGLTLGLALRERGVDCRLFERSGELAEVGAAVAVAANGSRILCRLGLGERLDAVSDVPTELIYRHWRDGRVLARHPAGDEYRRRFGAPLWGVHRAELQRALYEAWGVEAVRLGRVLTGLREVGGEMVLRFADGEEVTADVVVGADGVHSAVREWVAPGSTPVYSGTSGFRGLAPVTDLPSLPDPGAIQYWLGPGAHLLHYRIGSVVNFLAVLDGPDRWDSPGGTAPSEPGELAARFDGWHPAVREMINAVPQSPRWALLTLPALRCWSRAGAVLLGDSAHAMVPHHGQGANQTIEDAAELADCLADAGPGDRAGAFAAYQRRRRARTRQVQRASWDTSAALHLPDGPEASARDARLRSVDADLEWIHGHGSRAPVGRS
ncbi:MAG TPA: FAD-dependent monooxygenase [Pseudonocardia sp.]